MSVCALCVVAIPTKTDDLDHKTVLNTDADIDMMCSFEARPPASITWHYSDDTALPADIFSSSSTDTSSGVDNKYTTTQSTLTWNSQSPAAIRRNKDGVVKCLADNGVGSKASRTRTLTINCKYMLLHLVMVNLMQSDCTVLV